MLCLLLPFALSACSLKSSVDIKFYFARLYKLSKVTKIEDEGVKISDWQEYYSDDNNLIDCSSYLKYYSKTNAATINYYTYNTIQFTYDGQFRQKFTYSDDSVEINKGKYYEVDKASNNPEEREYKINLDFDSDEIEDGPAYDRLLKLGNNGGENPNYIRLKQKLNLGGEEKEVYLWYYCAVILGDSLISDKSYISMSVGQENKLTARKVKAIPGLDEPIWTVEQDGEFIEIKVDEKNPYVVHIKALSNGKAYIYGCVQNDRSYALMLCEVEVK